MRNIDWKRGHPYIFRAEDYKEIIDSDRIFARKFDTKVDKDILEKIYEYLNIIRLLVIYN